MPYIKNIAFINKSSVVSDQEAARVMQALQVQLTRDFYPAWGETATLYYFNRNQAIPQNYWWLVIVDYNESSHNAGLHDLTPNGMPMGLIPAKAEIDSGYQWSVTASHELLEMIEDPGINISVRKRDGKGGFILYSYEVCDACEAEQHGYLINGVLVSDFVFPEWFEDFEHQPDTRYDIMNFMTEPFQILEGGYISVNRDYSNAGWVQLYADPNNINYWMRPYRGSRRDRRRTPRDEWILSENRY